MSIVLAAFLSVFLTSCGVGAIRYNNAVSSSDRSNSAVVSGLPSAVQTPPDSSGSQSPSSVEAVLPAADTSGGGITPVSKAAMSFSSHPRSCNGYSFGYCFLFYHDKLYANIQTNYPRFKNYPEKDDGALIINNGKNISPITYRCATYYYVADRFLVFDNVKYDLEKYEVCCMINPIPKNAKKAGRYDDSDIYFYTTTEGFQWIGLFQNDLGFAFIKNGKPQEWPCIPSVSAPTAGSSIVSGLSQKPASSENISAVSR